MSKRALSVRIQKSIAIRGQYFEGIIAELQALKIEEHRLIHLYARLLCA
jgi:hypothetical protein